MAKTKTGKTTKGSRQPQAKRLGFKLYGEHKVHPGNIILRQRGSKFYSGEGTKTGRDFTIYAVISGRVKFYEKRGKKYIAVTASS